MSLQSWRETFEACKAAGLKLPDGFDFDDNRGMWMFRHDRTDPELGVDGDAALALCRWTAFEWLKYPTITDPLAANQWYIDCDAMGDTIDAALQAACRQKASVK